MLFKYRAKDRQGKEESGTVEAAAQDHAVTLVLKKGLFVTKVEPMSKGLSLNLTIFKSKVPLKEKIVFTQQMAVMIRSGLGIVTILKSLQEETNSKALGQALEKIIPEVESGGTLSSALAKFPEIFDSVYLSIVASGEESGKLDEVLERQAKQMDKTYDLVAKVRGALIYPAVITVALIGVAVFVLIFILPKLKSIFADSGVEMPAITKVIMGLGDLMTAYWYYLLAGLAALIAGLVAFHRTPSGKLFFDKLLLKLPIFGNLYTKSYMANFARTFASLSASGIPILKIFKVVKDVIPNVLYHREIEKISKEVENGKALSAVLKESKLFPSMIHQLTMVGEKSGKMDEVYTTLADFYERDVTNITKNLSSLIEPVMMIVLGAGIGLLLIAVLQPIYGLVGAQ